jgi:hypothetical protein
VARPTRTAKPGRDGDPGQADHVERSNISKETLSGTPNQRLALAHAGSALDSNLTLEFGDGPTNSRDGKRPLAHCVCR